MFLLQDSKTSNYIRVVSVRLQVIEKGWIPPRNVLLCFLWGGWSRSGKVVIHDASRANMYQEV